MPALYTIAFHEVHFTAQIKLAAVESVRKSCEKSHWFGEFVLKRMLRWSESSNIPIGFQIGALDGLTNVWSGFWHHNGSYASFTLIRTRLR